MEAAATRRLNAPQSPDSVQLELRLLAHFQSMEFPFCCTAELLTVSACLPGIPILPGSIPLAVSMANDILLLPLVLQAVLSFVWIEDQLGALSGQVLSPQYIAGEEEVVHFCIFFCACAVQARTRHR